MAVRQYIGARYVPKFYENSDHTAEWRAGVIYEPLTIVTYNGNSYTSKKAVPANIGNPSANSEYWVATGIFSEQVEEIRATVADLEPIVERVNIQNNGTVILIGDSYGNSQYSGWCEQVEPLIESMGYNCITKYGNGASFYANSFRNLLTEIYSTIGSSGAENVKYIGVFAGINDAHADVTDFDMVSTGIQNFCTYAKANFSNAKLFIGFIGNSVENSSILNGRKFERIPLAFERYAKCGQYGASFIPNCEYILHDYSLMSSDGIHPTYAGGGVIAQYIAGTINGGGVDIKRIWNGVPSDLWSFNANVTDGITFTLDAPAFPNFNSFIYQDNGIEEIQLKCRLKLTYASATNVRQGAQILAGKIESNLWSGKPITMIPLRGLVKLSDNTYTNCTAHLLLASGNVYIRIDQLGLDYTPQNHSVSEIIFDPIEVALPTMAC